MTMNSIIEVRNVSKTYSDGFEALKDINLSINSGEIFALLGPNGAGKTTLISIICGITKLTKGTICVSNLDIIKDYRETRKLIGLVPQELTADAFNTVLSVVNFSRGIFGLAPNPQLVEKILKDLSLWDKRNNKLMTLSGGMKRRVLIAKALAHEPQILFLDEPTAGVDVDLRKDMWELVRRLKVSGVTIILTTHYIEEAQEMADRVGVISKGKIILVEEKNQLMSKMGKKQLNVTIAKPLGQIPENLAKFGLILDETKTNLTFTYDTQHEDTQINDLFKVLGSEGFIVNDLETKQSSLEEIFVELVREK